jgi:RNA 2',3'-cyclic 3'-phosphodiesterase
MSVEGIPLWFFALCLPAEVQSQAVALFDGLCDDWLLDKRRALIASRLHITAFPIGSFVQSPQRTITDACAAADTISFAPFEVSFDRVITWRTRDRSYLVLTADRGCEALLAFQHKLHTAIRLAGVRTTRNWGFRPHVTLRYNESIIVDQQVPPLTWRVDEFVLIESLTGQTIHRHHRKWPLTGSGLTAAA